MPKIDPAAAPFREGTDYPAPYDEPIRARRRWRLGEVAGLTAFGVNRLELDPGVWSSQRHSHSLEDEFVIVLQGEVVLVEDVRGKGHLSKAVEGKMRHCIFVPVE